MPHQLKGLKSLVAARKAASAGKRRAALEHLDSCLRRDPSCLPAYLLRAALLLVCGQERKALNDLERADTLPPSAVVRYGDLYLPPLPGLTERCRASSDGTASAWAQVILSFSLRSESKMQEAAQAFDAAISRRRSPELLALKARLDLSGPRAAYKGSRLLREAVQLAPKEGWIRCWLGEALRHEGDPAGALAAMNEGLRIDPGYRPARAWRAALLIALGRPRRALADLGFALRPLRASGAPDAEQAADARAWALNQRSLARRALGDVD
jgi:tetratricopeptide (TPR) repeat protein